MAMGPNPLDEPNPFTRSAPNPLDEPNPFALGAPPIPLEGIPQGQTPMDSLGGLAMKFAPFFMGEDGALGDFGITPLMATMNAMGVTNPLLLSAIMQNDPSQQAGSVPMGWGGVPRQEAARVGLGLMDEFSEQGV